MAMAMSVVVPRQQEAPCHGDGHARHSSTFARQLWLPAPAAASVARRLSTPSLRAVSGEEPAVPTTMALSKPYLFESYNAQKEEEEEEAEEAEAMTAAEESVRQSVALAISLGIAFLLQTEPVEALGPGGPRVEEFWENMSRYGVYFLTVATGGIYSIVKPLVDLFKNPFSAVLLVGFLSGTFYLLYVILSTMLGLGSVDYTGP